MISRHEIIFVLVILFLLSSAQAKRYNPAAAPTIDCSVVLCRVGTHCQMVQPQCFTTPCPPIPVCKNCTEIMCPAIYKPVCGSDAKTYGNSCEFERAQCENSFLTSTDGECPSPSPKPSCPTICYLAVLPVCGSDGVTYTNKCFFKQAKCRNPSLKLVRQGACS